MSLAGVLLLQLALAQEPKFEVASVRLAIHDEDAPAFRRGGPGTDEPERITYQRQSLMRIFYAIYGLDWDQISGPSWLGTELYTIVAKVPPGATKDQVKLMWKDLLAERFRLQVHFVKKDFPAYELSIAKGGPKFHREPGFPVPAAGKNFAMTGLPPRTLRQTFQASSMAELVRQLSWPLSTIAGPGLVTGRIVDKTGLDGKYDFTLEFAGSMGPGGAFPAPLPDGQADTAPYLADALRQQLGLILVEKKTSLDVLVVDHADRIPSEN